MRHDRKNHAAKLRLLQSTALVAFVASAGAAQAQVPNTTAANVNVLNLLSPFLGLNGSAIGQSTLQGNLQQSIAINNAANLTQQQLAISDKNLLGSASNSVPGAGNYGVAANLAGGLPAQTPVNGITPQQPVGGLGVVLGQIYQNGVAPGLAGPLTNTVNLLTRAYNFTSSDLGVAKNYFANGAATNPSVTPAGYVATPAVAPAGYTLPTNNGLPNTGNSVYDIAYGVKNTDPGQDVYGSSRPAQVARSQFNVFDPTALNGIETNPSFPSGHTTYAFTDSILIAMLVPELYQSMMLRAADYGNSRIALGVHYPLDIIASRAFVQYELAQALTNTNYINNTATTGTAINMPALFTASAPELRAYLATQCGGTIAACATSAANTANDPYLPSTANQTLYQQRLAYNLPTLSYAEAPREAAPAGGPDASILLATVYGGSTAAARALAPTGGISGSLQTSTINQIIVNTEGTALAAFYGTTLSYWSRIDLYSAAGYFQNVIGTINLAPTDVVTGPVTVADTGVLAGTGTVGATTVARGGALQPGTSTSTGVLTINGNLAFQSGAAYVVQTNSTATSSVNVTGTAALAGSVRVASTNGSYALNRASTILTSGALNGTRFETLTAPTGLVGSLSYSGSTVQLSLTSGLGQVGGLNANQRSVGTALDNAFNANGSTGALSAIYGGNVAQTLAQASGETATGSQQATFDAMTQFLGVLQDPSIGGRGDSPVSAPLGFAEDGDAANAYASTGRKRSAPEQKAYGMVTKAVPYASNVSPWGVWAAGFGGSRSTDGNAAVGSTDTTSRVYGGVVGADYRFSRDTVAGFALAGGGTSFSNANGLGSGRSDLFQAGAFLRHTEGAAYISAAMAYGWQDVTTERTITISGIDRLQARFNANAYSGRLEGGYRLPAPVFEIGLTPYAAGQFTTFELPGYGETAIGGVNTFALNYGAKSVTASRSELGLRADKSFLVEDRIVTLRGRAAWAHDFNADRTIAATFQALPGAAFTVNGAALPSDAALTTATAEVKWRNGFSLAATFEGEFSDVSRSYAGKGVARFAW